MNETLEIPYLDDPPLVLHRLSRWVVCVVMSERDEQLHALLVGDELVHIDGLSVDLEVLLDLEVLRQIEVLSRILWGLTWLWCRHHGCPEEQEEHVKVNHVDHINVLDGALTWLS